MAITCFLYALVLYLFLRPPRKDKKKKLDPKYSKKKVPKVNTPEGPEAIEMSLIKPI